MIMVRKYFKISFNWNFFLVQYDHLIRLYKNKMLNFDIRSQKVLNFNICILNKKYWQKLKFMDT